MYEPLHASSLNEKYGIILPHEENEKDGKVYPSKETISTCDFVLAEVSFPSTGMGIELGWANSTGRKIICIHRKEMNPSKALRVISNTFLAYTSIQEIIPQLKKELK